MTQETTMAVLPEEPAKLDTAMGTLEGRLESHHQKLLHAPANNLHESVEAVTNWYKRLPRGQREIFDRTIVTAYLEKISQERTYGIILAGEAVIQSAAPRLLEMLNSDMAQLRQNDIGPLIVSLGALRHMPAYNTIEQFVDTEYSLVAVHSLARIDFENAVLHLNKALAGKYSEWRSLKQGGKTQRLALLFADLMYDAGHGVGPKAVLTALEENKGRLNIDPLLAREAFAQAFEYYCDSKGKRIIQPKRAHYYIKQIPRILTGKQGAPLS